MAIRLTAPRVARSVATAALVAAAAAFGACSSGQQSNTPGVTVRDSAGVNIVLHSAEAMAALPVWTIADAPVEEVTAGADSGFSAISDVLRRRDGRYVISDRQRRDIRLYEAGDGVGQVIARSGRGPGEVGMVSLLQRLPGDSLGYADGNQLRYSIFAPDGRFVRQVNYPDFDQSRLPSVIGRLDDGRLLGYVDAPLTPDLAKSDTVFRQAMALITIATTSDRGAMVDTLASVPDQEIYYQTTTEGGQTRPDLYPLRFGKVTRVATDGRRVVVTTNDGMNLLEFENGRLIRRVQAAERVAPFTAEEKARLFADLDAQMDASPMPPAVKDANRRMRETWRFATHLGHIERLFLGDDGTIWGEAPTVTQRDARRYIVFDSTGLALARVHVPSPIVVRRATANEVIGVTLDENDVPRVARWKLRPRY